MGVSDIKVRKVIIVAIAMMAGRVRTAALVFKSECTAVKDFSAVTEAGSESGAKSFQRILSRERLGG